MIRFITYTVGEYRTQSILLWQQDLCFIQRLGTQAMSPSKCRLFFNPLFNFQEIPIQHPNSDIYNTLKWSFKLVYLVQIRAGSSAQEAGTLILASAALPVG